MASLRAAGDIWQEAPVEAPAAHGLATTSVSDEATHVAAEEAIAVQDEATGSDRMAIARSGGGAPEHLRALHPEGARAQLAPGDSEDETAALVLADSLPESTVALAS